MSDSVVLYGWRNDDWERWFYIGAGSKVRSKETTKRSKHFIRIINNFNCSSHILCEFPEGTPNTDIEYAERTIKQIFKDLGEPISDGEPNFIHRETIMHGIAAKKARGEYKGRQPIEVDKVQFEQEYNLWKSGQITATAAMTHLGLKPNTFYRRVKEYEAGK